DWGATGTAKYLGVKAHSLDSSLRAAPLGMTNATLKASTSGARREPADPDRFFIHGLSTAKSWFFISRYFYAMALN
ncbi:MAG TPA: hypothetical protein V6D02_09875, partial [Candidatus Obscuribacterales bacterium]